MTCRKRVYTICHSGARAPHFHLRVLCGCYVLASGSLIQPHSCTETYIFVTSTEKWSRLISAPLMNSQPFRSYGTIDFAMVGGPWAHLFTHDQRKPNRIWPLQKLRGAKSQDLPGRFSFFKVRQHSTVSELCWRNFKFENCPSSS